MRLRCSTLALLLLVVLMPLPVFAGADPCLAGSPSEIQVTNNGFGSYRINGIDNASITVIRGCTYTFNVSASGHPFLLKTVQGNGNGNQFTQGVNNNGVQNGTLSWTVDPATAQSTLFYNCQFHAAMTGTIQVIDSPLLFGDDFETET